MGALDIVRVLTDGGPDADAGATVHHECRECGRNLSGEHEVCPDCGGGVARYDIE